jgi:hypothetical protein
MFKVYDFDTCNCGCNKSANLGGLGTNATDNVPAYIQQIAAQGKLRILPDGRWFAPAWGLMQYPNSFGYGYFTVCTGNTYDSDTGVWTMGIDVRCSGDPNQDQTQFVRLPDAQGATDSWYSYLWNNSRPATSTEIRSVFFNEGSGYDGSGNFTSWCDGPSINQGGNQGLNFLLPCNAQWMLAPDSTYGYAFNPSDAQAVNAPGPQSSSAWKDFVQGPGSFILSSVALYAGVSTIGAAISAISAPTSAVSATDIATAGATVGESATDVAATPALTTADLVAPDVAATPALTTADLVAPDVAATPALTTADLVAPDVAAVPTVTTADLIAPEGSSVTSGDLMAETATVDATADVGGSLDLPPEVTQDVQVIQPETTTLPTTEGPVPATTPTSWADIFKNAKSVASVVTTVESLLKTQSAKPGAKVATVPTVKYNAATPGYQVAPNVEIVQSQYSTLPVLSILAAILGSGNST